MYVVDLAQSTLGCLAICLILTIFNFLRAYNFPNSFSVWAVSQSVTNFSFFPFPLPHKRENIVCTEGEFIYIFFVFVPTLLQILVGQLICDRFFYLFGICQLQFLLESEWHSPGTIIRKNFIFLHGFFYAFWLLFTFSSIGRVYHLITQLF